MSYDAIFRIAIIGDCGVGKSSIVNKFTHNEFNITSTSTIGVEFASKIIIRCGKKCKLQIWDLSGNPAYIDLINMYLKNVCYVVLVYDITNTSTFLHIQDWYNNVKNIVKKNTGMLIVGNKTDLVSNSIITTKNLAELSDTLNIPYITTSCNNTKLINTLFNTILVNINKQRDNNEKTRAIIPISAKKRESACSRCAIM
tara:strand:- start:785 stop:1381 length:597 start_codon:yes stop_codon:yes gene_type:complete